MNGFFNVYKSSNTNSTFLVNKIKRLLKTPCGHMGTLDPMASGVLPIAVGKSTRLFDYFSDKQKTYEAEFKFGFETDTLDATGKTVFENGRIPEREEIEKALKNFIGEIDQVPPKYCANSVNGKRGYELARKGIDFELKSKKVKVYSFELLEGEKDTYKFKIVCGKGTYIRSLARDLGYATGTYATMTSLCRTVSGVFKIENSVTVEDIALNPEKYLIRPDETLDYEKIFLSEEQTRKMLNGVYEIPVKEGLFRVYSPTEFLGVGKSENGLLKVKAYVRC